jgi:hypothetical protein
MTAKHISKNNISDLIFIKVGLKAYLKKQI